MDDFPEDPLNKVSGRKDVYFTGISAKNPNGFRVTAIGRIAEIYGLAKHIPDSAKKLGRETAKTQTATTIVTTANAPLVVNVSSVEETKGEDDFLNL